MVGYGVEAVKVLVLGFGVKVKSLEPFVLDVDWNLKRFVNIVILKDILVIITYIKLMV